MTRKEKIFDYAIKEIYSKGISNVTMKSILSNTNTTSGSFYHVYSGKEDILYDFFVKLAHLTECKINELFSDLSLRKEIYVIYGALLKESIHNKDFCRLLFGFISNYKVKRSYIRNRRDYYQIKYEADFEKSEHWNIQSLLFSLLQNSTELLMFSKSVNDLISKMTVDEFEEFMFDFYMSASKNVLALIENVDERNVIKEMLMTSYKVLSISDLIDDILGKK